MKSVVELDINIPQAELAELFADPRTVIQWMSGLEKYEPISGSPGMPGSVYRLVPKRGTFFFVATVVSRDLPHEVKLHLDSKNVTVSIAGRFFKLTEETSKLVSEEEFTFKGAFARLASFFAINAIKRAHRTQMLSFKAFAEKQGKPGR